MPDDIMTLKEVAEYLKLAEKTAYRLAADGTVPGFKVGGSWRFRKTAIEDWIDQKTTKKRPKNAFEAGTSFVTGQQK